MSWNWSGQVEKNKPTWKEFCAKIEFDPRAKEIAMQIHWNVKLRRGNKLISDETNLTILIAFNP